jgi:pimeloyl-ACP methyl ester carboxylesterase
MKFPTTYYSLHEDANINFQLNRCLTWIGEKNLNDLQDAGKNIHDFNDWKRELLNLAESAEKANRINEAAYYFRAAEFFMTPDDQDKKKAYDKFIELITSLYPEKIQGRVLVPYKTGFLPVLRLSIPNSKGTILFHGGFDSFIEELFPVLDELNNAGYELIVFEGPGQGAAIRKYDLPMTPEWEKPVKAILDYFHLDSVTILGMSLGGVLAMQAAAYEPRIKNVIAFDVMYDFFECITSRRGPVVSAMMRSILNLHFDPLLNVLCHRLMQKDLLSNWGIHHGMYVTGKDTPAEFLRELQKYTTREFSDKVTQNVLLMAGEHDHFLNIRQYYQQSASLINARSITGRIFTNAEQAQNHCQIGNIELALEEMINWLNLHTSPTN